MAAAKQAWAEYVSTLSRPKAAGWVRGGSFFGVFVSTLSRPKAAGTQHRGGVQLQPCFNTQPPEGGWDSVGRKFTQRLLFQHSAARRRLDEHFVSTIRRSSVSTLSRPKAAGIIQPVIPSKESGFNTQPPEGGWVCIPYKLLIPLSFNTQPPEGGWRQLL